MDKRRVRLEINGVVCGLITEESEEYMQALGGEVGDMMSNVLQASPFVTREAAALTAALSYCDDSKKREKELHDLRERCDELEVEAELWQEEKEKILKAAPADDQKLAELSDALTKARAEQAEAEKRLASSAEEAAALPLRIQELEAENKALLQRLETAPPQSENLEELEKRLSALQAENEELARKTAELEADKEEFRRAAAKVVEEAKQVKLRAEQKVALAQEQVRIALAKEGEAPVAGAPEEGEPLAQNAPGRLHNPLRHNELDREGLVSFFEKKA